VIKFLAAPQTILLAHNRQNGQLWQLGTLFAIILTPTDNLYALQKLQYMRLKMLIKILLIHRWGSCFEDSRDKPV
jgi:hypothetical protein